MAVAIGPGPEFFQDPRRLTAGGIRQRIAERLRAGRLLLGIAGIPIGVMLDALERARLFRCRLSLDIRTRRHRKRDVNAGTMRTVLGTERRGHRRPPVAALRAVTDIAETIHQHRPRPRDAIDAQPVVVGLPEKPKPGSDGQMTWNASAALPP